MVGAGVRGVGRAAAWVWDRRHGVATILQLAAAGVCIFVTAGTCGLALLPSFAWSTAVAAADSGGISGEFAKHEAKLVFVDWVMYGSTTLTSGASFVTRVARWAFNSIFSGASALCAIHPECAAP